MDKFIVKASGVNRFNLFGWVAAGLLVLVASLGALALGAVQHAIYFVLFGIFGVLLQTYCPARGENRAARRAGRSGGRSARATTLAREPT